MFTEIDRICDVIASHRGEDLLRFMSAVYHGLYVTASWYNAPTRLNDYEELRQLAIGLGLLSKTDSVRLTDVGYLVANVAKEYCNWLDNNRETPKPKPPVDRYEAKDVLDIGCSYGRWLWDFQRSARSVIGVELQEEYILLGRVLAAKEGIQAPRIHLGSADRLDDFVRPGSVDFVFSRLVFNHVMIRATLAKTAQVLRRGGTVWLHVDCFRQSLRNLIMGQKRLRSRLFSGFAVVNSLACTLLGAQFSIQSKGRMHCRHQPAYPTIECWRRMMREAGLSSFKVEYCRGRTLVIAATKED